MSAPALIVNPASGGGKAGRHDLERECRARGVEAIVCRPGTDLAALADEAVAAGADVIGMAGGDGSQAAVAAVAASHDVPFVCVPAGTRNHFALDLGLDPNDVVGALDAFRSGVERRIDLARVNGRVFVNNVSMGLYGRIVQSPEYRDAKLRTVIKMLPEMLGPGVEPFDLRFSDPDGEVYSGAKLVLVSNNPYQIDPRGRDGTRGRMNLGVLGVVVAPSAAPSGPPSGPPVHPPVRPPVRPPKEWTTPTFRIESRSAVEVGVDGEGITLEPPLLFESLPSGLRVLTVAPGPRPG